MKKIINILAIAAILVGCRDAGNKRFLVNSSGKAGELIVVIENELWDSYIGDSLRYILAQSQIALPQPEPLFSLIPIPPEGFQKLFKGQRNIFYINISPKIQKPSVTFETDKWAGNQLVLYVNASNEEELLEIFLKNKYNIISKILETEKNRLIKSYKSAESIEIRNALRKNHKLTLSVPHGYTMNVDTNSFVWISRTESGIDQGILVYYYPYFDESDFEKDNLIAKRNEFLRKYVHGVSEGSYMTTEDLIPVYSKNYYKDNGLYISELRGLWKLEKGFMGGPFISHSTVDTVYDRIVTAEGYIFAPQKDKRNLLRQVEAIISTLEIKE